MTHAEFHAAVGEIAGDRRYTTSVEVRSVARTGRHGDNGQVALEFTGSIQGHSETANTPEEVLSQLRIWHSQADVDALGDVAKAVRP